MKRFKIIPLIFIIIIITASSASAQNPMSLIGKYQMMSQRIVTVMYHMISENPEQRNTYCITPEEFEEDIIFLKNNNYIFATANELDQICAQNPQKNVALLTFDDGYESDYTFVLPLLKKYNAKATFFVIGSKIGQPSYMNKSQLKLLSASPYAEIGNHSFELHNKTVPEIIDLYSQYTTTEEILNDFNKNKTYIEGITGKPLTSLSYPNGIHTYYADAALKNRGICKTTLSTNEVQYFTFLQNKIIGRYNRSDLRTVQHISYLLK